jgi:penicillin-binding protein 1B
MVKGPSYYNPRRHPLRAKQRRDLVLKLMLEGNLISAHNYQLAIDKTLMVVSKTPTRTSRVPAFMGLVKRELSSDYSRSSLKKDGLKLFTSLDPIIQEKAENSLTQRLNLLDNQANLQGAVILSNIESGEIQAVVGDRNPNFVGFNRAIDAYRQTGSIIKPFVYLTALLQPSRFNLNSQIKDKEFSLAGSDQSVWKPKNYDEKEHGDKNGMLPLSEGLVNSYNLATAQLAMKVGIENIVDNVVESGFERELLAFPSIALGSKEMSPVEVLTLYQVIANRGRSVKPRVLLAVQDQRGELLTRYAKKTEQIFDPEATFLIRFLLTEVAKRGTARSLFWQFPNSRLAGKTGTTNDLKDSWFAGFDNNQLAVVWIGRDDNRPIGLTGAKGALMVWADLFKKLKVDTIDLSPPKRIVLAFKENGFFDSFSSCKKKNLIPFYENEVPKGYKVCEKID